MSPSSARQPGGLDADRQRARSAGATGSAIDAGQHVVWGCLRADAAPSRRPVLDDHHRSARRGGLQNFFVHRATDPAGPWSDPITRRRLRHRSRTSPGTTTATAGCTTPDSARSPVSHRRPHRRGARRAGAGLVGHRRSQYPEAPHLFRPAGALVSPDRRRRHRAGPRRLDRPRPDAQRTVGAPVRPTRSSATAAPIVRSRTPATPIWSRRPTARGGWCCSAPDRAAVTPGCHVLGRETFLAPVELGRRLAGGRRHRARDGECAPGTAAPASGEFATTSTRRRLRRGGWPSTRRENRAHRSPPRSGWLTLRGGASLDEPEPTFLGVRQQHHTCRVRARVELDTADAAGLSVWMDDRRALRRRAQAGESRGDGAHWPTGPGSGRCRSPHRTAIRAHRRV